MKEMLKASDQVTIVDVIDPDALAASTVTTAWVLASNFNQWMAIILAGDLGASATLNAKFEQATDGSGTGAKDVTGALITALTQAGTDSDKQAIINLRPEALDVANNFDFIRLSLTVGVAASEVSALLLGLHPRYGIPAHDTTVDEIVTV